MEVKDDKFILKPGSEIAPDWKELAPSVEEKRISAIIEEGILKEDVELNSPSACGGFIIGGACNGWANWKNKDGELIDIYRYES